MLKKNILIISMSFALLVTVGYYTDFEGRPYSGQFGNTTGLCDGKIYKALVPNQDLRKFIEGYWEFGPVTCARSIGGLMQMVHDGGQKSIKFKSDKKALITYHSIGPSVYEVDVIIKGNEFSLTYKDCDLGSVNRWCNKDNTVKTETYKFLDKCTIQLINSKREDFFETNTTCAKLHGFW